MGYIAGGIVRSLGANSYLDTLGPNLDTSVLNLETSFAKDFKRES
jgi:hypothetical protein